MSNTGSRSTRHFFNGSGAYIALFLVATALAVAGYWSLLPHSSAEAPAAEPAQVPLAPAAPLPAAPKTPPAAVEPPKEEREEAAPAQSVVTVTLPDIPDEELAPVPPALVVRPLVGETVAAFSMEELQYSETMGDWRTHDGVDLAAEPGTPVCAASRGTVTDVREDDLLGTTVVIAHDGGYDTIYANLQSVPAVSVGDEVTAGQIIGSVGRTALSESRLPPHLHFSVTKDGEFVEPAEFVK